MMTKKMMQVKAIAQYCQGWWAVEVPHIDGLFTQTKRLDHIPEYVKDAAELLGCDPDSLEIIIEPHSDRDDQIRQAKELSVKAGVLQQESSQLLRATVCQLIADGLPLRDIGALLGISFQRAHQLAKQS